MDVLNVMWQKRVFFLHCLIQTPKTKLENNLRISGENHKRQSRRGILKQVVILLEGLFLCTWSKNVPSIKLTFFIVSNFILSAFLVNCYIQKCCTFKLCAAGSNWKFASNTNYGQHRTNLFLWNLRSSTLFYSLRSRHCNVLSVTFVIKPSITSM